MSTNQQPRDILALVPVQPQIDRRTRDPGQHRDVFFCRFSACHNTIRALVPTTADTSALFTSACNSARSSVASSTRQANTIDKIK